MSSGSIHTCIDRRLTCLIVTLVVSDKNVKQYFPRKVESFESSILFLHETNLDVIELLAPVVELILEALLVQQ